MSDEESQQKPFTIIVTGGRTLHDRALFKTSMERAIFLVASMRQEIVVGEDFQLRVPHGCCPSGADRMAAQWTESQGAGTKDVRYPADWERYGKKAGPIRNSEMITAEADRADLCLAFWDGHSTGTLDCYTKATRAGIPVLLIHI